MIVKNFKETSDIKSNETCLFKRFGWGVHLIRRKDDKKFRLLIICNEYADALFIAENNLIYYMRSDNNKLEYGDFDKIYEYIKPLKPHELVVDCEVKG